MLKGKQKTQVKSGFWSGIGIAVAGLLVAAGWSYAAPKVRQLMNRGE